jgi:hypothetical protein
MSSTVAATTVASIVGGELRRDAPGGRLTSTNPARTDDIVAEVLLGDASTFVDAARAARGAQKAWAAVPAPARGRVIAQVGRLVEANKEALAALVTREIGKPYPEALGEVQEIVDTCDFFLGEGRRLYGQTVPSEMPDKQLFTVRTPVGVAAIGYALVSALEAAVLAGAAPSARDEIEAAADLAESLAEEWGPGGGDEAVSLARALHDTVPVIAGAELAAAAAYRWKCQFNENASLPAFCSVLPEADHNEVMGWAAARELGRFSYVSLEDGGVHPRNALRAELTAEAAAAGASPVLRVASRGESRVERLVSLVLLGDLVSIYAAVLRGADPVEVAAIDALKAALASR